MKAVDAVGERLLGSRLGPALVSDRLLRRLIRSRVRRLVGRLDRLDPGGAMDRERRALDALESGPVTVDPEDANRQHYELPPAFFQAVLGPRLKYSCCYWPAGVPDLAMAEEAMLELTAERAGLTDGQEVLDLGCGWGSFSVWAAERFPHSRILAVSNSRTQKSFIEGLCRERGLTNLRVATADVASFEPGQSFDRVVSVEMLEHVRNHKELLRRLSGWLRPDGRLFIHVFCHRRHLYAFEPHGEGGWMAGHFFSGGMMPAWDYLPRYQDHLVLIDRWKVDGNHYARTLRAWLDNLDANRNLVMPLLDATYGPDRARLWSAYWRLFFMACEETFALGSGGEYFVAHYLLGPRPGDGQVPVASAML